MSVGRIGRALLCLWPSSFAVDRQPSALSKSNLAGLWRSSASSSSNQARSKTKAYTQSSSGIVGWGCMVGVVKKVRDATGNLLGVSTHALFGTKKTIEARIQELGIGQKINTSHVERVNGTLRGQQARLARRSQAGSRLVTMLCYSVMLWRDLYNWVAIHSTLGCTPAVALGLARKAWTVLDYVRHPVHVSDLQREFWEEQRNNLLKSPLDDYERKKALPTL